MGFKITGTGSSLPQRAVTNDELTSVLDTSDEWIRTRTGIERRRIAVDESAEMLASRAAELALERAGVTAEQVDLIICATMSAGHLTPSLACIVCGEIGGRSDCITLDVNMACCGFLYAMYTADSFFKAGRAKKALIVAAERMSDVVDWTDRSTAVLFGDGAGAALLEAAEGEVAFDVCVKPDVTALYARRKGGNCPFRRDDGDGYLKMNGQEVYKFASDAIEKRIRAVLEKAHTPAEEVDMFLLHQANRRIIESAVYKLQLPREKFPQNIAEYGNTSAASVAILLDELYSGGRIKNGQKIVMCAFGAGLASISCLIAL